MLYHFPSIKKNLSTKTTNSKKNLNNLNIEGNATWQWQINQEFLIQGLRSLEQRVFHTVKIKAEIKLTLSRRKQTEQVKQKCFPWNKTLNFIQFHRNTQNSYIKNAFKSTKLLQKHCQNQTLREASLCSRQYNTSPTKKKEAFFEALK